MSISRSLATSSLTACLVLCLAAGPGFSEAAEQGDRQAKVIRLSEPVEVTATHEVFGSALDESGEPVSLGALVANSDRYLDQEVLVETRINKVCQKKGCFFIAQDGADYARVSFKDYGFFIPTDSAGKTVLLRGVFLRREIDREQAEHYAADLGDTRAREAAASVEYQIVASAISIPKA
jgi:hypothetical protein